MSIESARAFYERMITDEGFRIQYQNAVSNDERREFVLAAGYNFTPEEWEITLAQISQSADSELSDAELTAVSGGVKIVDWPPLELKWKIPKEPPLFPLK